MTVQSLPAVCYLMPHYSEKSSQHDAHLPRLLSEIASLASLYVIVEKADRPPAIPGATDVLTQRWSKGNGLLRAIELAWLVVHVRRRGCRRFFVRIAIGAGLVVGVLGRLLGLETYFWHSGMGKEATLLHARQQGVAPWLRARFRYRMLRWVIHLSHHLVTGPECMAQYYMHEYGAQADKVIVLYNDIDTRMTAEMLAALSQGQARQELGLPSHRPQVLFLGRVGALKGAPYLPRLMARVARSIPDVLFLVVGPVVLPAMEGCLRDAEARSRARVLGPVPNATALACYRASDVFILPSDEEGFPRRLLESMAMGTPFVAFDVGGVRDIVDPRQIDFVVPPGDVEQMAERIVRLLRDPDLRASQARIGVASVERFATTRVAKMFVERILS